MVNSRWSGAFFLQIKPKCLFLDDHSNVADHNLVAFRLTNGHSLKKLLCILGYDMSPFIRRYAKYLNDKALSYRTVAFDFCKVKRGKEEGSLRTMNADKLLKTLPVLQAQLDGLLEFDCTANDLTNGKACITTFREYKIHSILFISLQAS